MHPNKPLKDLFNKNNVWLTYLNQNIGHVRDAVMENVTKILACGTAVFGSRKYTCSNGNCSYTNTSTKPANLEPVIAMAARQQIIGCKPNNR